jgi:hypothetical protein
MPFPSLTPIRGGKLVLAPSRPDTAAEIVEHKINILESLPGGTIEGDRSDLGIKQLSAPTGFKPMAVESFPAASPDKKRNAPAWSNVEFLKR